MMALPCRSGACLPAGRELAYYPTTYNGYKGVYYVYAIKSQRKNYIYVGLTKDAKKRIRVHNKGWEKTTRSYAPFSLILQERFYSRSEARKREKYLKSGIGKEFLKNI